MSEQPQKATRAGEPVQKTGHPYAQILQLNQELVQNLQGLVDEHETRKKELEELRFAHDQARAEMARLEARLVTLEESTATVDSVADLPALVGV